MYHVILYWAFSAEFAKDKATGEPLVFNSLEEADHYGQSVPFLYEPVQI